MYRRYKTAGHQAEQYVRGQVVLAYSAAHLEVLMKHGRKRKRNRLDARLAQGKVRNQERDMVHAYLQVDHRCR